MDIPYMCTELCTLNFSFFKSAHSYTRVHVPLTTACCVYSNVYVLGSVHCIRYHTAIDSNHSTSPALQKYYTLTSCSVKIPVHTTAKNSASIWEVPVPYGRFPNGIRRSATSRLICHAQQSSTTFTDVFQGH